MSKPNGYNDSKVKINFQRVNSSVGNITKDKFDRRLFRIFRSLENKLEIIRSFAHMSFADMERKEDSTIKNTILQSLRYGGAAISLVPNPNPIINFLGVFVSFAADYFDKIASNNSSYLTNPNPHDGIETFIIEALDKIGKIEEDINNYYDEEFRTGRKDREKEYVEITKLFYPPETFQIINPISEMTLMLILSWCDKIRDKIYRPFIVIEQKPPTFNKKTSNPYDFITFIDFYNFPKSVKNFFENDLRNLPLIALTSMDTFKFHFDWKKIIGTPIPIYYFLTDKFIDGNWGNMYIKLPKEFFWKSTKNWRFCSKMEYSMFVNLIERLDHNENGYTGGNYQKWRGSHGGSSYSHLMNFDKIFDFPSDDRPSMDFVFFQSRLTLMN